MRPAARMHVTRWVSLTIAIALLLFVRWAAHRHEEKLRALMTHGQPAVARVNDTSYSSRKHWAHFSYTVGGVTHESTVDADAVPGVGGTFPIVYRPEKPQDHWIGPPLNEQVVARELGKNQYAIYFVPAVAFLAFLANEYQLRRHRRGLPRGVPSVGVTQWAFTIGLYGVLLAVSLASDSRETFVKAFGPQPLGMSNTVFVVLLLTILYLPAVWIMPHVASLIVHSNPTGEYRTRPQAKQAIRDLIERDPAMKRSNRIAVAGILYFLAVAVAWIVYASYRRI